MLASVSESPSATMAPAAGGATTSTPQTKYQSSVRRPTGMTSSAAKSPGGDAAVQVPTQCQGSLVRAMAPPKMSTIRAIILADPGPDVGQPLRRGGLRPPRRRAAGRRLVVSAMLRREFTGDEASAEEDAMTTGELVIDCDGHILEPPDLWESYLEPAYRDRALRIRVGDDGFEHLEIDGRRSTIARPGQLGTLGGMGTRVDEARELRERAMRGEVAPQDVRGVRPSPEQTYLRGAAFGTMDMEERVQLLDREGMAKA